MSCISIRRVIESTLAYGVAIAPIAPIAALAQQAPSGPPPAAPPAWQQGRTSEQAASPLHPFAPHMTGRPDCGCLQLLRPGLIRGRVGRGAANEGALARRAEGSGATSSRTSNVRTVRRSRRSQESARQAESPR